jgi:hypothetical protein
MCYAVMVIAVAEKEGIDGFFHFSNPKLLKISEEILIKSLL